MGVFTTWREVNRLCREAREFLLQSPQNGHSRRTGVLDVVVTVTDEAPAGVFVSSSRIEEIYPKLHSGEQKRERPYQAQSNGVGKLWIVVLSRTLILYKYTILPRTTKS